MPGWLFAWAFLAVTIAYVATELLLRRLIAQHRVVAGESRNLSAILIANLVSLAILLIAGVAFVMAAGVRLHLEIAMVSLGAQLVWLAQHLWLYSRNHLHLSRER